MADDRYSWLDEDAAERLLRGASADAAVGADDPLARAQAERLAAALADAADVRLPGTGTGPGGAFHEELPGEAAALAAFRKAREERADVVSTMSTRGEAPMGAPPSVRLGRPKPPRRGRPSRFGRPLRAGLAVALAGCALGGVAVAAGAGVLPAPFGGGSGEPLPAQSVSAGATSGPDSPPPSHDGGTDRTPDRSPTGRPTGERDSDADRRDPGTVAPSAGGHGRPSDSGGTGRDDKPEVPGQGDGRDREKLKFFLALCQKYETGGLDARTRLALERAAGGSQAVDRYCDRLSAGGSVDGGTGSDSKPGGDGHGDGGTDDSGDADRGGNGPGHGEGKPSAYSPTAGDTSTVPATGTTAP
ncbi:hypothetical protein ABT112_18935 [Streptomyces sp. NPDC002055]|uniref:hypothetical protein n=1 Tax=Streptomyces sp. NPDC002055 TaxID=3154534 RepID=UPI0033211CD3